MKNLFFCLAAAFFLNSCVNEDKRILNSFKGVEGLLYYEKPETGPVVYAVFLPFAKKNTKISLENLDSTDYKDGVKFAIANSLIKDRLYSINNKKLVLKGMIDRSVYLLSNVNIYFHIDTPIFDEESAFEKELQIDTLVYMHEQMKFKYRFSWLRIDSIKVNLAQDTPR